jgi:hypothetical protein
MWYRRRLEALCTYILYEGSFQLAETLRKTINMSKKDSRPSKIVADSSLTGNKVGMRERVHDAKQHVGYRPYVNSSLQRVLCGASIQCMVHS